MFSNITKNTSSPEVFTIGWFRFPTNVDDNYETIIVLHDILVVLSFFSNLILLFIIIKTLSKSSGKNTGILIASICLTNIFVFSFGVSKILGGSVIDYGIMTRVKSIFLPMYYLATFCLALNHYGLIVTPLKFQILSPKPKTMIGILVIVWLTMTLGLVIIPSLASDFDVYVELTITAIVALCWLVSIIIAIMYTKILLTLYQRKLTLQRTLNISRSRQGLVVIKQNSKLARVLAFYTLVLVVLTLPLYTSVILAFHCSKCNTLAMMKFTLYSLPLAMTMPIIHVFHWLLATPQYYREIKKLIKKIFAFCGKKK